jgi:chromosome segregation protein
MCQGTKGAALLKLRKVDLLGFKSFCERTTITFSGTGVTCIVGPNGCGKSNIVDAISWVLGEQSHKLLRAERMADCIFNGTQKRPPMGLAEVSLTLVDPELAAAAEKVLGEGDAAESETNLAADSSSPADDGPDTETAADSAGAIPSKRKGTVRHNLHLKPGEIVVGRRLYRSGQSEYLINGRVARLRDIQELFMGVGLGPNSYAIIEQGRIGQILSSRPMDRRAIIEEAAGVTKYKTKRRLAEAKLESSKLNLARVNDILAEVEKQLASLKRQASKARRYAELREQMRALLRQVLASKAQELDAEAARLEQLLREIARQESEHTAALETLEAEHERLNARSYELEGEIRQNQNLLGQTALELDRTENRIGFNRERMAELAARAQQLAVEAEAAAAQIHALQARLQQHGQSLTALREEYARLEAAVVAGSSRAAALSEEEHATAARVEQLHRTVGEMADALAQFHAEYSQAEQALEQCADARARLESQEATLAAEAERCHALEQAAQARCSEAEAEARRLVGQVSAAQARLAALRQRQAEISERCEALREKLVAERARRSSLQQILDEHTYSADAVQKLFAANGEGEARGFRAVGVLADYTEVQEQYETAVEQFLREELEYVVVETFDHARAGIALLRDEVGGRATFFVDSLRNLQLGEADPPAELESVPGVVARLDRLVEFRDPLGVGAKHFLPRLRSAYLVESAAVAERLAGENTNCQFLTPDGTCYQGRLVSGGRACEAGPLATKRELRALESRIAELEREAAATQVSLAHTGEELRACEQELAGYAAQQLEAEKQLVAASHELQQARADRERANAQLAGCREELARIATALTAARVRAEQARQQRTEALRSRRAAETESAQAGERLAAVRAELQALQETIASQRAELAAAAERLFAAEQQREQLAAELDAARQRETSLHEQRAALETELAELEASTAEQQHRQLALAAEKARLEERKAALEGEWDQARIRAVETEDRLRMTRQKLGELREQRGQYEIEQARNEAEREHLRTACLEELNTHPEDLLAQETSRLAGESLAAAEASYREMKARVESMGPINMMALEEYNECEQRFQFLTRERDDLVKSIEDTQQTIRELDEVSRQKFEEAFRAINANFAQAFATLFGGGTGEMRLAEPDSSGECGIDIVVQPPGKRLQNVMLLSGGEKALTALALLIAIFRYQPSPFCILDEVDAPLDEANIGRFTKLIAEMSDKTQFIIVTHNRRTMEMAPVLYGVTMQEPGVSKLVSVRWDEPQEATAQSTAA